MSVKLSVVYDNPTDPEAFEKYYTDVHLPLVAKVPNIRRAETAKVIPKEDGTPTPAYRLAELYFDDYKTASASIASPEGQAALADAKKLGSAGVKFLLCNID